MKERGTALLLALTLGICTAGCGAQSEETEDDNSQTAQTQDDTNGSAGSVSSSSSLPIYPPAWKHYHRANNTSTYVELKGDIVLDGVDFGYVCDRTQAFYCTQL